MKYFKFNNFSKNGEISVILTVAEKSFKEVFVVRFKDLSVPLRTSREDGLLKSHFAYWPVISTVAEKSLNLGGLEIHSSMVEKTFLDQPEFTPHFDRSGEIF